MSAPVESYSMGDLIEVCETIGLPKDLAANHNILRSLISPAVAAEFAYADITHPPQVNTLLSDVFGKQHFSEGTFGTNLRALHEGPNQEMSQKTDGFVRFFANFFAHQCHRGDIDLAQKQKISVRGSEQPYMVVADNYVPLAKPAQVVIDYGPGLHAAHHIDDQFRAMDRGERPFSLVAYDKGPYNNEFLKGYYSAHVGDNPGALERTLRALYVSSEEGLAHATNELIASARQQDASPALADVVIACGLHAYMDTSEITTGIQNAHELLVDEGKLILWAPTQKHSKNNQMSVEEMMDCAEQTGFTPSKADTFTITGTRNGLTNIATVLTKS